ncbi:YraN family protein [bacterium]|nr:YraN family protein [bacterium]
MNIWQSIRRRFAVSEEPEHLRRGRIGEAAANKQLQRQGLKFLTANFRSKNGEIDLVFRDGNCLVFVEVKTRTSGGWVRPAGAVNARKRRLLSRTALDYLKLLPDRRVNIRFDIVEVLLTDGEVTEVRHLPNTFSLAKPFRHG